MNFKVRLSISTMESTIDVDDLCRTCGTFTSQLDRHLIFETNEIQKKISSCLHISVSTRDDLPKFICGKCEYTLTNLHEFQENCIKTQIHLQSLVKSKQITEQVLLDTEDDTEVSTVVANIKKSITSGSRLNKKIVSKRPIRAVRLNNEVSYNSDGILESLLYNNPTSSNCKKVHKNEQRDPILKQCKFCDIVLPSREYQLHISSQHKNEKQIGKVKFLNLSGLQQQKNEGKIILEDEDKKEKMFHCSECKKAFKRKQLLILHMRRHTGERPYPCHLCEKKYASKSTLNSHILKHKEEWKHVCNFCGKGFVDKHSFIYHVRSNHTGERPFACTTCDKKFIKKQDLMKHKQSQHTLIPTECYACETCNKVCKDYDSLRSHKRSHIPVEQRRVHKCTVCEASFTGKTGLAKHMHRHTGEMPYECEQCAKRFFTKKGLQLHLVIHSGVKSFICEICGRAFSQDNTLRVHKRTHTGERPYECVLCCKKFTQSSALNSHKKLHFKDRQSSSEKVLNANTSNSS